MMTSSESLSQIALSVGFSDQSHLCKRFKQAPMPFGGMGPAGMGITMGNAASTR